jgi:hypothetical protein
MQLQQQPSAATSGALHACNSRRPHQLLHHQQSPQAGALHGRACDPRDDRSILLPTIAGQCARVRRESVWKCFCTLNYSLPAAPQFSAFRQPQPHLHLWIQASPHHMCASPHLVRRTEVTPARPAAHAPAQSSSAWPAPMPGACVAWEATEADEGACCCCCCCSCCWRCLVFPPPARSRDNCPLSCAHAVITEGGSISHCLHHHHACTHA